MWRTAFGVAVFLNGQGIPDRDELGDRVIDDSFLLLINTHHGPVDFTLPDPDFGAHWTTVLDTADPHQPASDGKAAESGEQVTILDRSLSVLRRTT